MSDDTEHQNRNRWAQDVHGDWKDAATEEKRRGTVYFCDCPDKHRMRLVKSSGDTDKRYFQDYFAHIHSGYKHTRDGELIPCRSGGESKEHRAAKHRLREMVGTFKYVSQRCKACRKDVIEDGRDSTITLEMRSADGRWRYDCMLIRHGKPVAALEIFHRHATAQEKLLSTRQDGIAIAEFRAEDVNAMHKGTLLENLCPLSFTCQTCLLDASEAWITRCQGEERRALQMWESQMAEAYLRDYTEKKRRRHEDMMWMATPCTSNINQWHFLDSAIAGEYHRLWEIGKWRLWEEHTGLYYYSVYHPPQYTNGGYTPYEMVCKSWSDIPDDVKARGKYSQYSQASLLFMK